MQKNEAKPSSFVQFENDHISHSPTLLAKSAIDPLRTKRIKMLAREIHKLHQSELHERNL